MPKILVVDDSDEVREVVKTVLVLKDFTVVEASSGKQAMAVLQKETPDLVVLDLMLPDMDGIEVCKNIKKHAKLGKTPILMLTARTGVYDRVKGLEIGADDYLGKPFDTLELLARVNALLRRSASLEDGTRMALKNDRIEMDPGSYTLTVDGKPVKTLTPREFDILYVLMKNCPRAVTREDISHALGTKDEKNPTRVIDIHIAKIRKKIGAQKIKTIPGKGYLLSPQ
jgi:two-component system alkaline phosphatase synthesis response regulator PhoP